MQKTFILAILAILIGLSSGCATRRVSSTPPVHSRSRISLSTETRSIHNNSDFVLVPQEDGLPVETAIGRRTETVRTKSGSKQRQVPVYQQLALKTGQSVPLSYFQWHNRRTVAVVMKAYCPDSGSIVSGRRTSTRSSVSNQETMTCTPGQYMGMTVSRTVQVSPRRGSYGSRDLVYTNQDIRGPSGRSYY